MHATGSAGHQLRLLIADTDTANPTLTDDDTLGFLALHGVTTTQAVEVPTGVPVTTVRRAAADALDAIATSEVLVSKVLRTQDGTVTDGAKVSAELRARAASLRALADADDDAADDAGGWFDVVEFTPYPRTGW